MMMADGNDIMLEMQFGLGRDIPASPFSVEFGDELPGCCHPSSIGPFASGFDIGLHFQFLFGKRRRLLSGFDPHIWP
jgi:hypothetical protein